MAGSSVVLQPRARGGVALQTHFLPAENSPTVATGKTRMAAQRKTLRLPEHMFYSIVCSRRTSPRYAATVDPNCRLRTSHTRTALAQRCSLDASAANQCELTSTTWPIPRTTFGVLQRTTSKCVQLTEHGCMSIWPFNHARIAVYMTLQFSSSTIEIRARRRRTSVRWCDARPGQGLWQR